MALETAAEDKGISGRFFEKSKPYASSGAYINFLTEEEAARISSSYGPTFIKLREIKKKYDPTNFFRVNQNILPA
jgi:hypothetical protein